MLTLDVNGKQGVFKLNLPTSLNELTEQYLYDVSKHIEPADNYCVVGIVFREKLSTILLAFRKNKKMSDIPVIPIFIKRGNTDNNFINSLNLKDKLVVSPSDIMMGHHLSTPNNLLTINSVLDMLDGDLNSYNKLLSTKEMCYFIEFKLIPNCNIHGYYKQTKVENYMNPFVTKISDKVSPDSEIILPKDNIIV